MWGPWSIHQSSLKLDNPYIKPSLRNYYIRENTSQEAKHFWKRVRNLKRVVNGFPGNSYLSTGKPGSTQCISVSNCQRHRRAFRLTLQTDLVHPLQTGGYWQDSHRLYTAPLSSLSLLSPPASYLRVEKRKSYILPQIQMVMANESRDSNVCFAHKTKLPSHIFTKCYFGDEKKYSEVIFWYSSRSIN